MPKSLEAQLEDQIADCFYDPLKYVRFAFPWGEGVLAEFDGPDEWQTGVLTDLRDYVGKVSRKTADLGPFMEAIASGHGVGKALQRDEPVLTPFGWVPIGDLSVGDHVMAGDGSITSVTGIYPQGIRQVYRVTTDDGCSVLADGEHQWFTTTRGERKHEKKGSIRTTKEIAQSLTFPNGPIDGLNHQIPVCAAVKSVSIIPIIEPYLFGVWLGDGDAVGRITGEEPQMEQLRVAGSDVRQPYNDRRRLDTKTSSISGLREKLRVLGLFGLRSHEKFIPKCYLHSSIEQRTALLQGLLDTDGTVGKNCAVTFDSTSAKLADGVAELARSLGGVVRRSGKQGSYYGKICKWVYRLYISLPKGVSPFRLPHKVARYSPHWGSKNCDRTRRRFIRSIEPAGNAEAVCISVAHPSQLYITRDYIVTHNTALVAWVIKWFMATRPSPQIVVTANTMEQLNSKTWRELAKWNKLAIDGHWFEWTATRFYHKKAPDTWFAAAIPWSENNSEAFAGTHDTDVLVIFDEASKISDKIWEVVDGAMTTYGAMWLAFGNPTRPSGRFHDCFYKHSKYWKHRHVDSRNARVANKQWCKQIIEMYGEFDDRTKTRVYGEFPNVGERQLISGAAIDKALNFAAEGYEYMPLMLGVDVARFGDCETILQYRQGRKIYEPIICPTMDLMKTAAFVAESMTRRKPLTAVVDEIGIGAGVLDRLRQLGFSVLGGNSGNMSENPRYLNKRAEAYFGLKEFVEAGCELPNDKLLIEDLRMLSYDFTDKGRLRIDRKQDFVDEFGRSPDRGDALSLTFFYPHGDLTMHRTDLEPEAFMDS